MWRPAERLRYSSSQGRVPSREEAAASLLFSPLHAGRLALEQRTWTPAMVPWRATDDGFVSDAVVGWYERFARAAPGAIVVEATGVRDVPSGPLLRIGHDRYLPGLKRLVEAVERASGGRTRLFIQLIDFLAIRRRPEPSKYFERFLTITEAHKRAVGADDEAEARHRLFALGESGWREALTAGELEALNYGYRERVTDVDLPHIRDLPAALPPLFAGGGAARASGGFRRRRVALCARLHDGLVSLAHQHARRWLRRFARESAASAVRGFRRGAARALMTDSSLVADTCGGMRQRRKDGRRYARHRRRLRQGRDGFSLDCRAAANSTTRRGRPSAPRPIPIPARAATNACRNISQTRAGPFGRNAAPTQAIREAVRAAGFATPVVCSRRRAQFRDGGALARRRRLRHRRRGAAVARRSRLGPENLARARRRRCRTCEFTNYCEALDQKHKQVTCQLWDREALDDPNAARTVDGKRRLVAPDWTPP